MRVQPITMHHILNSELFDSSHRLIAHAWNELVGIEQVVLAYPIYHFDKLPAFLERFMPICAERILADENAPDLYSVPLRPDHEIVNTTVPACFRHFVMDVRVAFETRLFVQRMPNDLSWHWRMSVRMLDEQTIQARSVSSHLLCSITENGTLATVIGPPFHETFYPHLQRALATT